MVSDGLREQLIEAAATKIAKDAGKVWADVPPDVQCMARDDIADVLDAVLPRLASAFEDRWRDGGLMSEVTAWLRSVAGPADTEGGERWPT